jgi:heme A synthase
MKIVIKTFFFHITCIFIFAFIYLYLSEGFDINNESRHKYKTFTDFLLLSTTVQAGVGITDLFPISFISKISLMLQQVIMMLTHVITLYVFTL